MIEKRKRFPLPVQYSTNRKRLQAFFEKILKNFKVCQKENCSINKKKGDKGSFSYKILRSGKRLRKFGSVFQKIEQILGMNYLKSENL